MLIDPQSLETDLLRLESIEKASLRLVVQAIYDFRETATDIFRNELDKAQDKAEDVTREALDSIGMSKLQIRLYGKIDYKRARYVFLPEFALRQALFVDSKAEKGGSVLRLQIAQTSMRIWHERTSGGDTIDQQGTLPTVVNAAGQDLLSTTIFVKYDYRDVESDLQHGLRQIVVAALPSGLLQQLYNPNPLIHIWNVGPNSPARNEDFRTRASLLRLKARCPWRVQTIPMAPSPFLWDDGAYVPPTTIPEIAEAEEQAFEHLESGTGE